MSCAPSSWPACRRHDAGTVFRVVCTHIGDGRGASAQRQKFVASSDAAKLLEPVEHALDTISVLVDFEIAGGRVLPIGLWRNDGANTPDEQFLTNRVGIIALVGKKQPRPVNWHCQKVWNSGEIGDLATRQDKTKRAALTVCAGVDFARKAAA